MSLAPSLTETLAESGLLPRVVGVTTYDAYPPGVATLPKVGGFLDTSFEAIAALRPDAVFLLAEHVRAVPILTGLGVRTFTADHRSVAGILASFDVVGDACGVRPASDAARDRLGRAAGAVSAGAAEARAGKPPPRVLVVVGRECCSLSKPLYVSGSDGFYSDVLKMAGAENVVTSRTLALPAFSAEGAALLGPDVIVEIVPPDTSEAERDAREASWRGAASSAGWKSVPAVRDGRVVLIADDFASIPGPRFVKLAERLRGAIGP